MLLAVSPLLRIVLGGPGASLLLTAMMAYKKKQRGTPPFLKPNYPARVAPPRRNQFTEGGVTFEGFYGCHHNKIWRA